MSKKYDWVIVTEKPDQARHLIQFLTDNDSVLVGSFKVVHARGRLFTFKEPNEQNERRYGRELVDSISASPFNVSNDKQYRSDGDRLDNMPVLLNSRADGRILYKSLDKNADYLAVQIKNAVLDAEQVIVATDWDIEGELLFHDIILNEGLLDKLNWDKVYRLQYQSFSDADLKIAFENMQPYGDANGSGIPEIASFIAQGYARSIVDYEFGYTFSFYNELLKRQLGIQFEGGLGRLKLGILNTVLERENDIISQSLEPYYTLRLVVDKDNQVDLPDQFSSQTDAENMVSQLPNIVQIMVHKSHREVVAPLLFTRTSFIIFMNEIAKDVNWGEALQTDYEAYRQVSYPRTDNELISMTQFKRLRNLLKDEQVRQLLQERIKERGYNSLKFNRLRPRRRFVNDGTHKMQAHHAIIPIEAPSDEALKKISSVAVKQVYLEILMHSMAMFAENGVDKGQFVKVFKPGEDTLIVSELRQQTARLGWRKLTNGIIHHDDFLTINSGNYKVNYQVVKNEVKRLELYTFSDLLMKLHELQLGTESTREPIIHSLVVTHLLDVDENDKYIVNPLVKQILKVIDDEGWYPEKLFATWDHDVNNIKNMDDANDFIDKNRIELKAINEKVVKWYNLNQ